MATLDVTALSQELEAAIANMQIQADLSETGLVTRVGDGVAWIYGLNSAGYAEVVTIETAGGGA